MAWHITDTQPMYWVDNHITFGELEEIQVDMQEQQMSVIEQAKVMIAIIKLNRRQPW